MRFSLVDVAVATACMALGVWGASGVRDVVRGLGVERRTAGWIALPVWIGLGVVAFAVLASPIYRRLQLPPLLLPTCPCCGRRAEGYRILGVEWSRVWVACGLCERPFDLWWRRPAPSDLAPDRPSLLLSWPHSIGRWRRIERGDGSASPTARGAGR